MEMVKISKRGISVMYGGGRYGYPIERARMKTETDLMHWAAHLSTKQWMSPDRVQYFIKRVREEITLKG